MPLLVAESELDRSCLHLDHFELMLAAILCRFVSRSYDHCALRVRSAVNSVGEPSVTCFLFLFSGILICVTITLFFCTSGTSFVIIFLLILTWS